MLRKHHVFTTYPPLMWKKHLSVSWVHWFKLSDFSLFRTKTKWMLTVIYKAKGTHEEKKIVLILIIILFLWLFVTEKSNIQIYKW